MCIRDRLNSGAWRSSAGALGLQTPPGDWVLLAATTGLALLGAWQRHWLAVPRAGQGAGSCLLYTSRCV